MSPVARWQMQNFWEMLGAWVPLPASRAPSDARCEGGSGEGKRGGGGAVGGGEGWRGDGRMGVVVEDGNSKGLGRKTSRR